MRNLRVILRLIYLGDDWSINFESITGQLADSSMEDLNGKIVFQEPTGNRDWLDRIRQIQRAGAIAILYGTDSSKFSFMPQKDYGASDVFF